MKKEVNDWSDNEFQSDDGGWYIRRKVIIDTDKITLLVPYPEVGENHAFTINPYFTQIVFCSYIVTVRMTLDETARFVGWDEWTAAPDAVPPSSLNTGKKEKERRLGF